MYNEAMVNTRNKRGFTIIEVVLVLAIAGLIFLMVFVALPALQRSQRNTQRKRDVDRFAAAVLEYKKHNNGKIPMTVDGGHAAYLRDTGFVTRYIDSSCKFERKVSNNEYYYKDCGSQFTSPNGNTYVFKSLYSNSSLVGKGETIAMLEYPDDFVMFMAGAKCDDNEGYRTATDNPNDFAVIIKLEGGALYCADAL